MNFKEYKVDVPVGQSGKWKIERFEITQKDADRINLRESCNNHGLGYRGVVAGTYTRLCDTKYSWNLGVMMSDTPAEIADHEKAIKRARGNILINGLGIGVVLNACLMKPEVKHCTVVEVDPDVISLVAPHYQKKWGDRLTIVQANALTWEPPKGAKYSMIWHDIWKNICANNLVDIVDLKRKYIFFKKWGGWQGCWVEKQVRHLDRIGC